MKGRYNGCRMTIYGTVTPKARSIASWAWRIESLTEIAKKRIKILDWHKKRGKNISLTARHFGLTRYTLREWLKRFKQSGILGLNERSRRPKNLRKPTILGEVTIRIVQLRKQYPVWSKYKIRALLKREGIEVSASSVGRVLKRKGLINLKDSKKRQKAAFRPKARFPKGLVISRPGDMVQMDIKHIMLVGGKRFYQFTAIDVLTKRRILQVYPSESSRNGALFLKECLANLGFKVRAIQTDNGSTFLKDFDKLCQELSLIHYFIYPRTPKQNSYVEISHEADKREFYQQGNVCSLLPVMQKKIKEWEDIWNNVRPHEALGQLTPSEYLGKLQVNRLPTKNFIVLQT